LWGVIQEGGDGEKERLGLFNPKHGQEAPVCFGKVTEEDERGEKLGRAPNQRTG